MNLWTAFVMFALTAQAGIVGVNVSVGRRWSAVNSAACTFLYVVMLIWHAIAEVSP